MKISHARRKNKGSAAERELIHKFWAENWAAFRAAGSGSSQHQCPDLIAGNTYRKLAIEVKTIDANNKYFPKQEVDDLMGFSTTFGAEPWLAIKFSGKGWYFLIPEDLKETDKGYSCNFQLAELRGLKFDDIVAMR